MFSQFGPLVSNSAYWVAWCSCTLALPLPLCPACGPSGGMWLAAYERHCAVLDGPLAPDGLLDGLQTFCVLMKNCLKKTTVNQDTWPLGSPSPCRVQMLADLDFPFSRIVLHCCVPRHPHMCGGPGRKCPLCDVQSCPLPWPHQPRPCDLWQQQHYLPFHLPPTASHLLLGAIHRCPALWKLCRYTLLPKFALRLGGGRSQPGVLFYGSKGLVEFRMELKK